MKILILSDLHLEFEDFLIGASKVDVVILAGDIHVGERGIKWALDNIKEIPVIYILGNHEYYKQTYPKFIKKLMILTAHKNIYLLENKSVEICNVIFYGCTLWTDFGLLGDARIAGYECQQKMTDYKKIRKEPNYSKIRSMDIAAIHKQSVNWLKNECQPEKKKRVIVTHHAPSAKSLPSGYKGDIVSSAYASNLDELVSELSPDLWVHGHCHNSSDYMIDKSRIICNPKGYPDELNMNFQPNLIIEV